MAFAIFKVSKYGMSIGDLGGSGSAWDVGGEGQTERRRTP